METPRINEEAVTLFNDWDEQTGEFDTGQIETIKTAETIVKLSAGALKETVSTPEMDEVQINRTTVADAILSLEYQRELNDRTDAYGEYSGRSVYPFAEALDAYEPWHDHTRIMIERYQLTSVARSDVDAMSAPHKRAFSQSFLVDYERAKTLKRLIDDNGGEVANDTALVDAFGRGHSSAELLSYGRALASLLRDVEATEIPWAVRKSLNIPNPHQSSPEGKRFYVKRRNEALAKANSDRHKKGLVQIVRTHRGYETERVKL